MVNAKRTNRNRIVLGRSILSGHFISMLSLFTIIGGCIEINLPDDGLLSIGSDFVIKGVAESIEDNGACLVWSAIDGRTFILAQSAGVPNDSFDSVTTPGTASRLVIHERGDLGEPCREGAIVAEVSRVLEIDGEDETDEIKQIAERIRVRIDESKDELAEWRQAAQEQVTQRIEEVQAQARELINRVEIEIDDLRDELHDRIPDDSDELRQQIEDSLNDFVNQFESRVQDAVDELKSRADEIRDNIEGNVDNVGDRLQDALDDAVDDLRDKLDLSLDDLDQRLEQLVSQITDALEEFRQSFEERVDGIRDELFGNLHDLVEQLLDRVDRLPAEVEEEMNTVSDEDITQELTATLDALVALEAQQSAELLDAMEQSVSTAVDDVAVAAQEAASDFTVQIDAAVQEAIE